MNRKLITVKSLSCNLTWHKISTVPGVLLPLSDPHHCWESASVTWPGSHHDDDDDDDDDDNDDDQVLRMLGMSRSPSVKYPLVQERGAYSEYVDDYREAYSEYTDDYASQIQ